MEFLSKIFAKEGLVVDNGATINGLINGSASDRYLISDNGELKFRTAAQVLSDIAGAPASALANYQLLSQKAQPNGYASLDANGKVPLAQINDSIIGQVEYMGLWNASTNTPSLSATPQQKGHYYIVSVAGTQFGISFEVGDWIISDGTTWSKVDNTDAVSSVFGRVGNITAAEADYQSFYVRLSQVYSNPSWISALAWSKITGTPTTLGGYGITDAVPATRTITINGQTFDLSANRSWTISEADTLATVTARGNTTTSNIFLGQYLRTGSYPHFGETAGGLATLVGNNVMPGAGINKIVRYAGGDNGTYIILRYNAGIIFGTNVSSTPGVEVDDTTGEAMRITTNRNVLINTTVDTGDYRLDVNGSSRVRNGLVVDSFVAIGTSTPFAGYNIDSRGSHNFGSTSSEVYHYFQSSNVSGGSAVSVYANNTSANSSRSQIMIADTSASVPTRFGLGVFTGASPYAYLDSASRLVINNASGANVIIGGTNDDGFKLDVVGTLRASGNATFTSLAGSGSRMVVADANGVLGVQAIPTNAVSSVFGRTGDVVATNGDYTTAQVTESGNLYYTDARARAALSFEAGSGGYNSTTGVIKIPTNTNQLTNGAGYITTADLAGYVTLSTDQNIVGNKTFSGKTVFNNPIEFANISSPAVVTSGTTSIQALTLSRIFISKSSSNGGAIFNLSNISGVNVRSYSLPDASGTIALTSDIPSTSGFVPYTGATDSLTLGNNFLHAKRVHIDGIGSGEVLAFKQYDTSSTSGLPGYDTISTIQKNAFILSMHQSGTTYKTVFLRFTNVPLSTSATPFIELPSTSGTLALTSDIPSTSGFVPYTGATSNVDLGTRYLLAQRLQSSGGELISVLLKGRSSDNKTQLQFWDNSGGNLYGYIESAPSGLAGSLNIVSGNSSIQLTNSYVSTTSPFLVNTTTDNLSGAKLQVSGNGTFSGTLDIGTSSVVTQFVRVNANYNSCILLTNYKTDNPDIRNFKIGSDNTVYGDLAIQRSTTLGGSTYENLLYFDFNKSATFASSVTAGGNIIASNGTVQNALTYGAIGIVGTLSNHNLGIYTNNTQKVLIDTSGNVGIGTTSPNTRLHTTGSLTVNDVIYLQRASSSLYLPVMNYWDGLGANPLNGNKGDIVAFGNAGGDGVVFANANTERMRISGGNVLINTTTDNGARLQVHGSVSLRDSLVMSNMTTNPAASGIAMYMEVTVNGTVYLLPLYSMP